MFMYSQYMHILWWKEWQFYRGRSGSSLLEELPNAETMCQLQAGNCETCFLLLCVVHYSRHTLSHLLIRICTSAWHETHSSVWIMNDHHKNLASGIWLLSSSSSFLCWREYFTLSCLLLRTSVHICVKVTSSRHIPSKAFGSIYP